MLDERGLAGREKRLGNLIDGFRKEQADIRKWQGLMNTDEHERYLRSLVTLLQALEGARGAVSAACDRLSKRKNTRWLGR
jgi:hypothetical protein